MAVNPTETLKQTVATATSPDSALGTTISQREFAAISAAFDNNKQTGALAEAFGIFTGKQTNSSYLKELGTKNPQLAAALAHNEGFGDYVGRVLAAGHDAPQDKSGISPNVRSAAKDLRDAAYKDAAEIDPKNVMYVGGTIAQMRRGPEWQGLVSQVMQQTGLKKDAADQRLFASLPPPPR